MSALQDEIMKQIQQQQQMENYRKSQQSLNSQPTGLVGKVSNLGNSLNNFGSKLSQSQFQPIANLGVKAQGLGNTIGNFANASKGLGAASNALSNAAPAVGAATGALEVGGNLANGDYANAGLNAVKTGAALAGGPIGMGVSAAIQAAQMLKGAKDKANAEAMQKVNEEANKSMTANAQETSQAQQNFINDAQQAAQNMTQPIGSQTLSQDIISQINPNYTSSASGSPTGFASGINTPDETQTLQNDQSVVPRGQLTGGAASIPEDITFKDEGDVLTGHVNTQPTTPTSLDLTIPRDNNGNPIFQDEQNTSNGTAKSIMDKIRSGLSDFKLGYDDNSTTSFSQGDLANRIANTNNNPQPNVNPLGNAVAEARMAGYDQQQIDNMKQGLNGGDKDIAALIDKYNIRKPEGEEQIALAKNGDFNPDQITGAAASPAQSKKSIMQRIGEAAGTGQRILSNPIAQGLIAGTLAGINKGDFGQGLEYGVQWAQNKSKADNYYRQMHPNSNYTPVFGNYDANDYKVQQNIELEKQELAEKIRYNMATAEEVKRYHDLTTAETQRYHDIQAGETAKHHRAQEGIQAQGNAIKAGHYKVLEGQGAEKIKNSNSNSKRDYEFKVQQAGLKDGSLVRMVAPDGSIAVVPINQKQKYIQKGAKPIDEYQ